MVRNIKVGRHWLAMALALVLVTGGFSAPADARGGPELKALMRNAAEVPGLGDADGIGVATLTLRPGYEEVCFSIMTLGLTLPATGAHIHAGPAGQDGDVVVTLTPPDVTGRSSGCAPVDRELIVSMMRSPADYYINVHTSDYSEGAIRGQLTR